MFARLRCGGNLPQCLAFGTGNGLLVYATHLQRPTEQHLPHRMRFQRRAVPKAAPAAAAAASVRETAPARR